MPAKIQLIVGLGNPGAEYHLTRHNAGAWFVQALAHKYQISLRSEKRFRSLFAQVTRPEGKIILLIPQTYMNLSGDAVYYAAHYYQIPTANILVAHDELDLPNGAIKLKLGGGHAGHNGLKDIINKLASKEFWRLRIGIDHPRNQQNEQAVVDYVLGRPSHSQQTEITTAISRSLTIDSLLYQGSFNQAMLLLHNRPSSA